MKLDLARAQWRRSSYSGNTGNCVEVADLGNEVAVRDSKDPSGSVLVVSRYQWQRFMRWTAQRKFSDQL
jgi:hypothetical protein